MYLMSENAYISKRAIVIDDAATIRRILVESLTQMGFSLSNITAEKNGRQALDALGKAKFDLIISDWEMPEMDGMTLLEKVKKDSSTRDIPFLMVTSVDDKEKIKKAFTCGADQYVTKPFSQKMLEQTIHQLLVAPSVFGEKRVLVVEDSPSMRAILVKNLQQAGFKVSNIIQAENGDDAIALLCADPVQVVLTDWHMPKMNGLEFLKKVKARTEFKNVQFLMVTSESGEKQIQQAIQAGVMDYIIKPFNSIELQKKLINIFKNI